jgi:hypothetical protein
MKNFYMIQEESKEGAAGGSKETTPPAESKDTPPPQADGDKYDEFGYEKVAADTKEAPKEKPKEDDKPEEVKDPASGYGAEPPKEVVEEPVVVPPAEELKLDFELDLKDVPEDSAKALKEFAKSHKLSKEAAQALVDQKKSELSNLKSAQLKAIEDEKKAVAKVKSDWDKELRNDPLFGGNNFVKNVAKVEKALNDFFPETKKVLTERKSVLPPSVMRDISKLADKLYSSDRLVTSDEATVPKVEKDYDPLDFYNS